MRKGPLAPTPAPAVPGTVSSARQITLGYDANNRITSATANGRVWTYTYGSEGTLL